MQTTKTFLAAGAALLSLAGFTQLHAAKVLPKGESYLSTAFYYQSFDEFYAGDTRGPTPGGKDIERSHFRINAEWGLTERLGADLNIGYFDTSSGTGGPFSVGSQNGLADSYLGLIYELSTAEAEGFDSVVRLGATIPGDYETGELSAPGDDAFGVDLKIMSSFDFGSGAIDGYVGYWAYESSVPSSTGFGVTYKQYLPNNFWLEGGYHYFDSDGSLDIGGPGFTGANLPFVSEEGQRWEIAAGFADSSQRYYRISYSQLFDGRNIGREETIGVSVSFPF